MRVPLERAKQGGLLFRRTAGRDGGALTSAGGLCYTAGMLMETLWTVAAVIVLGPLLLTPVFLAMAAVSWFVGLLTDGKTPGDW